ncbi:MAG: PilZ domain-containing protein [Terriglobia bacterium]
MGTQIQPTPRRSERIYVKMPVNLRVVSERVEHVASTIDLSKEGTRACSSAGLLPEQGVVLIADWGSRCSIPGRIVWIGPIGSRLEGQAGIEFLSPLPVSA